MSQTSNITGKLETSAHIITAEGKDINLGILDRKTGIELDFFGKHLFLKFSWAPRLWYYKYVIYHIRKYNLRRKSNG